MHDFRTRWRSSAFAHELRKATGADEYIVVVPRLDLKFLSTVAATDAGILMATALDLSQFANFTLP
jgi:hypothetical protein